MDDIFAPQQRKRLTLRRGKERVVSNRHPWIFAGAIAGESGPDDAAVADLFDSGGTRLASGFYSPRSEIRLRALTFGGEELSAGLITHRIEAAIARRRSLRTDRTNAVRVVNAEGDELGGLVVDLYRDIAVLEIGNAGLEQMKPLIEEQLARELRPRLFYFNNDLPVRRLEHLPTDPEAHGEGSPATTILENGLQFEVDPASGQKTGFFLDQRENRELARTLAAGRRVLNLFAYTGAFGVYAGAGGATLVDNVEGSEVALGQARRNHELNGIGGETRFTLGDVFAVVRDLERSGERFGLIVCDPPAFAKRRVDVERAARGYKDVNMMAMRLLEPGGSLLTFSCSGHMSLDLFQKVIFAAALDAGRRISFVRRLTAGPDHLVSIYCPEGEYLKGFLLEARE